jgi:hypothetical protein
MRQFWLTTNVFLSNVIGLFRQAFELYAFVALILAVFTKATLIHSLAWPVAVAVEAREMWSHPEVAKP